MKNKLLILFIILSEAMVASGQLIDSATYSTIMNEGRKLMSKMIPTIMDSAKAAYSRDSTIFNDKAGNPSIIKFYIYYSNFILPMQQESYRDRAKKCLSDEEFNYFEKIPYKVISDKIGEDIFISEKSIEYDAVWISDLHTNLTLLADPSLNYFEHLLYLSSFDLTGIIVPPYFSDYYATDDIGRFILNGLATSMVEFFVAMHEFYHLYYEDRKGLSIRDEIKADLYALEACRRFTQGPDSNNVVNESDFESNAAMFGMNKQLNMFRTEIVGASPNARLFNPGVLEKEYNIAFLGLKIAQLSFRNNSRFFFANKKQLDRDLQRSETFATIAFRDMHCNGNDSTVYCSFINQQIDELKIIRQVKEKTDKIKVAEIRPSTSAYLKINKDDDGFIPFNLGNYYAFIEKNYPKALQYYSSANMLDQKSGYTILCNLIAYEIYTYDEKLNNAALAKEYLTKARKLNDYLHIISENIMAKME